MALDTPKTGNNHLFAKTEIIDSEAALRRFIPNYPKMLDKRIQTSLDYFSREFIAVSRLAILATNTAAGVMLPIQIQPNEFMTEDEQRFCLGREVFEQLNTLGIEQCYASLYFMAPALGHGLRVNGLIKLEPDNTCVFIIEQVYFHCARAAARSELWTARSNEVISEANFLAHCSYLLLKTINPSGRTELSPRGDEAGFIKLINTHSLLMPERPGNKVAISLRNILSNPKVQLLCLIPGSNKILVVSGLAKVISDEGLLRLCSVKNKVPKTGVLLSITSQYFAESEALKQSHLWQNSKKPAGEITSFPKALSAHINGTGLLGKVTSSIVGAVVKHDMKNLY